MGVSAASGGPNYVGIAALITAVSGLVGTLGTLWLAARRRQEADEVLERLEKRLDDDA